MNQTTEIQEYTPERKVEFVPVGGRDPVTLSVMLVKRYFAQRTKQGHVASDEECMKFVMLCKVRGLNPWEGDAYLQGYDSNDGPKFSLITAHQAFLKRAELNKNFDGMESGVVVSNQEGQIEQYEGDFVMPNHKLEGGWAKLYVKDRSRLYYKRLKLSTFDTQRGRWSKDAAGMIVKCAEADVLRTAYPTSLGGLNSGEEMAAVIDLDPVQPQAPALTPGKRRKQETIAMPTDAPETTVVIDNDPGTTVSIPVSPLVTLQCRLTESGIPYRYVQELMSQGDLIKGCTEIPIEALTEDQISAIDKHWGMIVKVHKKQTKA